MKSLGLNRYAGLRRARLLVDCWPDAAGSQSPIGPQGAVSQSRAVPTHKKGSLLYVAGNEHSYILSFPEGELLKTINDSANGACSNTNGDVFLTEGSSVVEYAHGSANPKATLPLPDSWHRMFD